LSNSLMWALLAAAGSLAGGCAVVWWNKGEARSKRGGFSAFSAGLLIVVAAAGLIPHALSESQAAAAWIVAGILAAYGMGHLFSIGNRDGKAGNTVQPVIWTAVAGMTVHSVFEGMAVGGSSHSGTAAAFSAALGLFLHKFPEGAAVASLVMTRRSGRWASLGAASLPGAGVMLGAAIAALFTPSSAWHDLLSPVVLAFAAGILLQIAGAEMLARPDQATRDWRILPLLLGAGAGLALMWGGSRLVPDHHAEAGQHHGHTESHHEHHSLAPVPVPDGAPVPSIHLHIFPDKNSGWNLHLETRNFRFVPAEKAPLFGEGHAHLYIDGKKVARVHSPWYHLDGLPPGQHTIRVELVNSQHAPYVFKGKSIGDEQVISEN
jgi:zinc transporter ZupT